MLVRHENSLLNSAVDIVSAYVGNNSVSADHLPAFIKQVYDTLARLNIAAPLPELTQEQKPAVSPKKSVLPDYIICLEDGKKFKSLKRHLMVHFGLTPRQYKAKWGLDESYPMVAPNYAIERPQIAKSLGLGQKSLAAS